MTLLTALGLASVAFVAVFTARAYRDNTAGNGQSRRSAIIEAWVNILIGFTIIGNLVVILVVARGLLSAEFLSILALPLFLVLGRGITYASPRVNGVQLTPTQFPEAYGMVVDDVVERAGGIGEVDGTTVERGERCPQLGGVVVVAGDR